MRCVRLWMHDTIKSLRFGLVWFISLSLCGTRVACQRRLADSSPLKCVVSIGVNHRLVRVVYSWTEDRRAASIASAFEHRNQLVSMERDA